MRLRNFLSTGHTPTLFSAFLYFDISFMVWVLMGVLGAYIAKDLGLGPSEQGLVAAIPILGGSLARLPLGVLVDHVGPKKAGILAQALSLVPLAAIWLLGAEFHSLLAFGFLLGIAGGSFAVALPLASRWYPPQYQGITLGLVGVGNSGTVLTSLFAPRLAELFGWRNVFALALIPVLLTFLVFVLLAKESPSQPKPQKMAQYFSVLREVDTRWFCFFYSITFGGFVGLASFLGIFFQDQYGLSAVTAGNVTALCVLGGSLARPLGGYWADRLGGVRVLVLLLGGSGLLMLAVALLPPIAVAAAILFLAVSCLGMGNGAVFQLVGLRFPREIGVVTGLVGTAGGLGGFFLHLLLGITKDAAGTYSVGFLVFAAASLGALAILKSAQRGWSGLELAAKVSMPAAPASCCHPGESRDPGVLSEAETLDSGFRRNDTALTPAAVLEPVKEV